MEALLKCWTNLFAKMEGVASAAPLSKKELTTEGSEEFGGGAGSFQSDLIRMYVGQFPACHYSCSAAVA